MQMRMRMQMGMLVRMQMQMQMQMLVLAHVAVHAMRVQCSCSSVFVRLRYFRTCCNVSQPRTLVPLAYGHRLPVLLRREQAVHNPSSPLWCRGCLL